MLCFLPDFDRDFGKNKKRKLKKTQKMKENWKKEDIFFAILFLHLRCLQFRSN
jgi:hypothetical protein